MRGEIEEEARGGKVAAGAADDFGAQEIAQFPIALGQALHREGDAALAVMVGEVDDE